MYFPEAVVLSPSIHVIYGLESVQTQVDEEIQRMQKRALILQEFNVGIIAATLVFSSECLVTIARATFFLNHATYLVI